MPVGTLILVFLVALALYFDRGVSDHDKVIDGNPKRNHHIG